MGNIEYERLPIMRKIGISEENGKMENEMDNVAARYWYLNGQSKPIEMLVNAQGFNEAVF